MGIYIKFKELNNKFWFSVINKLSICREENLRKKFGTKFIPIQDKFSGIRCVQTEHGFECGDIDYIVSDFSGMGLIYHFNNQGNIDHIHRFQDLLIEVLQDPEHIDIIPDYGEYSDQEIQLVKRIKQVMAFIQENQRPLINAELCE